MRTPGRRGSPIDQRRRQKWIRRFGAYRHAVNAPAVDDWLTQFAQEHRDLAARVLDVVEFVGADQSAAVYRNVLQSLPGWAANPDLRTGAWRFCAWSQSAGESGDSMLHNFRMANNLSGSAHRELFISPAEIVRERLGENDTLVFVNDFVGSGDEVCTAWNSDFAELTAGIENVYLLVVFACRDGRARVDGETDVRVIAGQELTAADNIFAAECAHFDEDEKAALLAYCERADRKKPRGYGDTGLVVVFQHRCPNNTIPILHAVGRRWCPLFPRND